MELQLKGEISEKDLLEIGAYVEGKRWYLLEGLIPSIEEKLRKNIKTMTIEDFVDYIINSTGAFMEVDEFMGISINPNGTISVGFTTYMTTDEEYPDYITALSFKFRVPSPQGFFLEN